MLQVVTGTLAQIATNPLFADYNSFFEPDTAQHTLGLLDMLVVCSSLNPMCTQVLAESWCYTTQFPLGGQDPEANTYQQGYGYLSLTQLNPNGVPSSYAIDLWLTGASVDARYSYAIDLWLTGASVDARYNVTVYGRGDGSQPLWVAYDNATNTPLEDQQQFAAHLHAALHDYPSALVVDA